MFNGSAPTAEFKLQTEIASGHNSDASDVEWFTTFGDMSPCDEVPFGSHGRLQWI
jgi:hypothetical protein